MLEDSKSVELVGEGQVMCVVRMAAAIHRQPFWQHFGDHKIMHEKRKLTFKMERTTTSAILNFWHQNWTWTLSVERGAVLDRAAEQG